MITMIKTKENKKNIAYSSWSASPPAFIGRSSVLHLQFILALRFPVIPSRSSFFFPIYPPVFITLFSRPSWAANHAGTVSERLGGP